ncbi:PAS domain S-box-containing protein [Nannocystis exedens]|uniref:histidine kinase n=1 Tax=Nannocystis exedens TaxID=54 RepID=A0A1I2F127_9BACT|nr:PAS domain S-box protein [Nannocystis exedens]PCC69581.1 histidine kinase [Nannocystis exedens]SFE98709.1 PAS domain S-box-containing protein [Nannocystis exedens]
MTSPGAIAHRGFNFADLERLAPLLFALLENAPEFVLLLSPDGVIRHMNRTAAGTSMTEAVGRSMFEYIEPESHAVARASLERVVATGQPQSYECVGTGAHGQPTRYESRVGAVCEGGEVVAVLLIAHDISKRVAMETELRQSREQLALAVAASGLGLWEWHLDSDTVVWNEVMRQLHGLAPEQVPRNFADLFDTLHPEDRAGLAAHAREVASVEDFVDFEYRIIKPGGEIAWLLVRGKPVRDDRGRVVKMMGGVVDITARKQAEEALRREEERYRSLVATLAEGIVVVDVAGQVVTCNASAERILGRCRSQLRDSIGLVSSLRAIHEDGSPFPLESWPAVLTLRTGEPQVGVIMGIYRPDGALAWVSVNSQPLYHAGSAAPYAVVTSFFDISDRKRADAERERLLGDEQRARRRAVILAEAGKLLVSQRDVHAALVEFVHRLVPELADFAAVEQLDEDGRFGVARRVSVAAGDPELEARYLDLRRRQPLVGDCPLLEVLQRDEVRLSSARPDAPLLALPGVPETDAYLAPRLRYRAIALVPLVARGRPLGVLMLATHGRALGPDELSLIDELALRAAQAIESARLYTEMELALAKREEFIAVASHELRTPLTPIVLQVDRLIRRARGDGEFSATSCLPKLGVIQRQADRLHRLIEELLDVSRITGGRLKIEVEDVDYAELLRATVEHFTEPLARAGCEIHLTAPLYASGRTDRTRFEQIVSNLLANAMKYGGGKPIELELTQDDETITLSVRDRGIGISANDQARIFQRFERAVSERHYGGLGLGLWVARHVSEAMGGHISVTSAPGAGSVFVVKLPRLVAEAQ